MKTHLFIKMFCFNKVTAWDCPAGALYAALCVLALVANILVINPAMADEMYRGRLVGERSGKVAVDDSEYVQFVIDGDVVKSIKIHVNAANKDLAFSSCRKLEDDGGSNFTKWFSIECRELHSYDGTPVMYEYFVAGAYAGISPVITPQYSMYSALKKISDELGLDVPSRTFIIYADRKPVYEFFCYPEPIEK